MEGSTPPTPPPPRYANDPPRTPLDGPLLRLMLRGNAQAAIEGAPQEETPRQLVQAPQQPVEQQQQPVEQQQPVLAWSPRDVALVAYHPEWPEIYKLCETDYPNLERRIRDPDPSMHVTERFESIIGIRWLCGYTMHYDRWQYKKEYQISFRTGPRCQFGNDIQFGSPARVTSWHGSWQYDSMMSEFRGSFKYNWPQSETLKWVQLYRDSATTWRGYDQEQRSIQMRVWEVHYFCRPASRWQIYDVGTNGEMTLRLTE